MGLNLGFYKDAGVENLEQTVKAACTALGDRLAMWELGNEPDGLPNSGQREKGAWTVEKYAAQWKDYASQVVDQAKASCGDSFNALFYGPSLASASNEINGFTPSGTFDAGLNDVKKTPFGQISSHAYMGRGGSAKLSDLMDHARIKQFVAHYLTLQADLTKYNIPFTIGEGNSLSMGGQEGVSDVFGAALWPPTSVSILHPMQTKLLVCTITPCTAKCVWLLIVLGSQYPTVLVKLEPILPYYGHLLATKTIGSEQDGKMFEVDLPNIDGFESMYVAYDQIGPKRITVLNMKEWNRNDTRNTRTYKVKLPACKKWEVSAERLLASSATAKTGVTFGGYSYDYNSKEKPQTASDTIMKASGAGVRMDGNTLSIDVPDSEAVLVTLKLN